MARTGNIAVLSDFLYDILFITLKTAMANLPDIPLSPYFFNVAF